MADRDFLNRMRVCERTEPEPWTAKYTLDSYTVQGVEIAVVRDDFLCPGTKGRYLWPLILQPIIDQYDEFFYVSEQYGGAQIALAWTLAWYNKRHHSPQKKTVTILLDDERVRSVDELESFSKAAHVLGADFVFRHQWRTPQKYAASKRGRAYHVPNGFRTLAVIRALTADANRVQAIFGSFDACFCAVGSGTLIQGLSPSRLAPLYVGVCVYGQHLKSTTRIHYLIPSVPFRDETSAEPPYVSALHYDAKIWPIVLELLQQKSPWKRILIWNVM